MVLALVAGCAQTPAEEAAPDANAPAAESDEPAADEPADDEPAADAERTQVTWNFFHGDPAKPVHPDLFGSKIGKLLTEKTGVTMEVEWGGEWDVRDQRVSVMIAAGDYPDVIQTHGQAQNLIAAGALVPLEDYLKASTNAKAVYKDIIWALFRSDGHIYELTPYREKMEQTARRGMYVAAGVLRENGWPELRKWSEYKKLIEDEVAKNPEYEGQSTIGWTSFYYHKSLAQFMTGPHAQHGSVVQYTDENGNDYVKNEYTTEAYKAIWKDLNGWWHDGILDKEIYTQNLDQFNEKIVSGRVVGMLEEYWGIDSAQKVLMYENPDRFFVPRPTLTDEAVDAGLTDAYNDFTSLTVNDGFSCTINHPDPDRFWQFIEDICAEDIQKLMFWGIEGEDYLVDEDGKMYRTPEMRTNCRTREYNEPQGVGIDWWWIFPHGVNYYSDGINWWTPEEDETEIFESQSDIEKEACEAYGVDVFRQLVSWGEWKPYGQLWSVPGTAATGSDVQIANQAWDDMNTEMIPKIVMSANDEEFEANWAEYVEKYNAIGFEVVEQYYNEFMNNKLKAMNDWDPNW